MIITDEQRIGLAKEIRYQDLSKQAVQNFAVYIIGLDGTNIAPRTPVQWAKERFIGAGIQQAPTSQDYGAWMAQMTNFLKDQDVWQAPPDPLPADQTIYDATIDYMIANSKFASLAEQTFTLRSQTIVF